MNHHLTSIIIPVYNSNIHLRRCLDSVLSQSYENIEIILIDDGSTDTSPQICDEYSHKYDNIKVYHISNGGASLARKYGMEMAEGDYLAFVDSDDYIAPNYISAMYDALARYDTKISCCGVRVVYSNESIEFDKTFSSMILEKDELMTRFFNYEFWGLPGALYHRSVFEDIVFPQATLSEDYLIKTQMFLKERRIALVESPLYVYEKHEGSLSNTKLSSRAFEEYENVKAVYDIIKKEEPKFELFAQKNVVETCIKLLLMGEEGQRKQFKNEYSLIIHFLRQEMFSILKNSSVRPKQRIIALLLSFSTSSAHFFNLILRARNKC